MQGLDYDFFDSKINKDCGLYMTGMVTFRLKKIKGGGSSSSSWQLFTEARFCWYMSQNKRKEQVIRWIFMFFIGTGTALVAVFIDYFVTTFYKLKFEWTQDGMEPCFPSPSPPSFQSLACLCFSFFLSLSLSRAAATNSPQS